MECCNTNSCLTTILLNGKEEKKSKKYHRHYKSKHEHRHRHDEQRKKNTESTRTQLVTEKIHEEKQDCKCINLSNKVCDHKNSHQRSSNGKSSNDKQRTIPQCLRQLCRRHRHHHTRFHSHSKAHCKTVLYHRTRNWNRGHKCMERLKHVHSKCRHLWPENKSSKEKPEQKEIKKKIELKLSPKNKLEFEYEDISNKSMDNYLNIPRSYKIKYVREYCKEDNESKLDTLIKRTKERERKLVEQSRKTTPWYTCTPGEDSSAEFHMSCSESAASLHSRSTLLLEPREHRYSSSIEGFCRTTNTEGYPKYSPSSYRKEDYFMKCQESNGLKIKHEPSTDIVAYSPTQDPESQFFYEINDQVKKEIKTEPGKGKFELNFDAY